VKAAPSGDEQPKIKVSGPPGWRFYGWLVTHLCKTVEVIASKEIARDRTGFRNLKGQVGFKPCR